jgi:8-oxo-dGTP diphosphatase
MIEAVVAVITNPENPNQLLAIKRASGGIGLPGGKVDPGETLSQAIDRELSEETGLKVFSKTPIFVCKARTRFCATYYVVPDDYNFSSSNEGEIVWVEREELLAPPFKEYNEALLLLLNLQGI